MTGSQDRVSSAPADPGGTGLPSLEGYFYQVGVSVLAAIDTLLAKKLTDRLVLEPAQHDDLEADLRHPEAISTATQISADDYQLIVQAKHTTRGPWKQGAFLALLKHGTKRETALDRLKDGRARYLLVTNAAVDQSLNSFRVRNIGEWPTKAARPAKLKAALPGRDSRRVAILSFDEEKIAYRLRDALECNFHVPRPLVGRCIDALRGDALARMRGAGGGAWTRSEIEAVIRQHEGYFASSAELELFVPPGNWKEIRQALADNKAIVLAGKSGTGKTLTAKVLAERLRRKIPGLTVKHITQGPSQISTDETTGPVAYLVEDPWGKYRFDPRSEPWNDELGRFLLSGSGNRYFIITSRSDVLSESKAKLGAKWFVNLEPDDYSPATRASILSKRLATLPRRLQSLAVPSLGDAVEKLGLPLEIQKYIENLVSGPNEGELDHVFISRCIREAHQDTLDDIVAQQVRQRDVYPWAAVIWGVLKGRPQVKRSVFTDLQRLMGDRSPAWEDGLEHFVNFLVSGQSLRQNETVISYYHPRVEAGLEKAMLEKVGASTRVLSAVADSLVDIDEDAGGDWGIEIVAKMTQAIRRLEGLEGVRLNAATQSVLDQWLLSKLKTGDKNYLTTVQLAADTFSATSVVGQFCAWLVARQSRWSRGFPPRWQPDRDDDAWYMMLNNDADARAITHHFVEHALPYDSETYPPNIAHRLVRIAPDISAAFVAAASKTVGAGYFWHADAVAIGAILNLEEFWPVVREGLDYLKELAAASDDGQTLQVYNGEFSEDYEEHLADQVGEDGYAAREYAEHYVAQFRKIHGWKALSVHERIVELGSDWVKSVRDSGAKADPAELDVLAGMAVGTNFEASFWHMAAELWTDSLIPHLQAALGRKGLDDWLRKSLVTCALRHAQEAMRRAIDSTKAVCPARFLEMLLDLGEVKDDLSDPVDKMRAYMSSAATGEMLEIADAFLHQRFDAAIRPLPESQLH